MLLSDKNATCPPYRSGRFLPKSETAYAVNSLTNNDNIIRCSDEHLQDLIKNHQSHVEQRQNIKKWQGMADKWREVAFYE